MPIAFYMDQQVPRAITVGLRLREVEVLTAYEDDASELEDVELLNRVGKMRRVLFTRDDDLLAEATKRQRAGIPFCGIVRASTASVDWKMCRRFGTHRESGRTSRSDESGHLLPLREVRSLIALA